MSIFSVIQKKDVTALILLYCRCTKI